MSCPLSVMSGRPSVDLRHVRLSSRPDMLIVGINVCFVPQTDVEEENPGRLTFK